MTDGVNGVKRGCSALDPAFPFVDQWASNTAYTGLSKTELFAVLAMQSLIVSRGHGTSASFIADEAVQHAVALKVSLDRLDRIKKDFP